MLVTFEQNRTVRTIQILSFFDKKWLTIFDRVLMPFWGGDVSVTDTTV